MDSETTPASRIFVKFGPHETDEIPIAWAEKMLTELHRTNGALFGRLAQLAMGIEPKKRA